MAHVCTSGRSPPFVLLPAIHVIESSSSCSKLWIVCSTPLWRAHGSPMLEMGALSMYRPCELALP